MKTDLTSEFTLPDVALFAFADDVLPLGIPSPLSSSLKQLAVAEGFTGKEKELVVLHPKDARPGRRVLLAGLGKKATLTPEILRRQTAALTKRCCGLKIVALDLMLPPSAELLFELPVALGATVEGAQLVQYRFRRYQSPSDEPESALQNLNLVLPAAEQPTTALRRHLRETGAVCRAVAYARDLVNEPPSRKTPETIGKWAKALAVKDRITVRVYHRAEIERMGMGGLLSVAAGSAQPPVFVHLRYEPRGAKQRVVLVGKGITFDSGGLNIKTGTYMNNMKDDMAGAAAVLALFKALAEIQLPLSVHGLTPLTENMPGGRATKVGDVFRALNGKTVEVLNTDAEGRLILADALSYGARLKPDLMIDIATLTGACVVALGTSVTGMMGTHRPTLERLLKLGQQTGEDFWELPLYRDYREMLKSKVADLANIGKPGQAGTIIAGLFLQEFVGTIPWVHLDIAGTAWTDEEKGYLTAGATGVPVRTLWALLRTM